MTVLLSSRQREILKAMADGATLRWFWAIDCRYRLDGTLVDGRSVQSLRWRSLVTWHWRMDSELVLTDAGRRAVQSDGDGS